MPHADLGKTIKDKQYKPCLMRVCAVRAGVIERAKPHRDIAQVQFAAIFMADMRSHRTWTARYLAEGLKCLRARGGHGRKPAVSDEDVARQSGRCRRRARPGRRLSRIACRGTAGKSLCAPLGPYGGRRFFRRACGPSCRPTRWFRSRASTGGRVWRRRAAPRAAQAQASSANRPCGGELRLCPPGGPA